MKTVTSPLYPWTSLPRAGRWTAIGLLVASVAAGAFALQRSSRLPIGAASSVAATQRMPSMATKSAPQSYVGVPPSVADEAAHAAPPPGEWPAP